MTADPSVVHAKPPPADDLRSWTARLVEPRPHKLERETGPVEYLTLPSLIDQLEDDLFHSGNGGGGRTKPGSRAPLNINVLSLLDEMKGILVDAINGEDLTQRDTLTAMVRQISAHIASTAEPDVVQWWAKLIKGWVGQAEACLPGEDDGPATRPLRDSCCPDCKMWNMERTRDGDTYREPALAIVFRDGLVRHVMCRLCGYTAFRGAALLALADTLITHRAPITRALTVDDLS